MPTDAGPFAALAFALSLIVLFLFAAWVQNGGGVLPGLRHAAGAAYTPPVAPPLAPASLASLQRPTHPAHDHRECVPWLVHGKEMPTANPHRLSERIGTAYIKCDLPIHKQRLS